MTPTAHIGPTLVIKGEVVSGEDLLVSGRIDGTLRADGHVVTINPGSEVAATVTAGTIVVAGTVVGTLTAEERIELQSGCGVDGELTTAKLKMVDGAVLHGRVEMPQKASLRLAS